ncbi:MAG: LacI family transcriptional regulator [Propionibacteriaceae bacterium]|jgi:DNA-binding LacI/PurR family transcriptional regulator|nr:LacI family transcriptional regulator [Propionibacteriaceae bacterium]
MKDVAREAGVSLSTVSYALNGTRPISTATRAKVERAAEKLGFRPNALARGLASAKSGVLALVLPPEGGFTATMAGFVRGARESAADEGFSLVIWPFAPDDHQRVHDLVHQRLADGVIVMEVYLDDQRIDALEESGVPFAMIGRTRELANRAWVDTDFAASVDEAVGLLADLGHTHVAFLSHSERSYQLQYGPSVRAVDGFADSTRRRAIVGQVVFAEDSAGDGRRALGAILDADPATTGIVAMNEFAAIGAVAELGRRHLSVPGDLSIIGVVTSPQVSLLTVPELTRLSIPAEEMGRAAVAELIDAMAAKPRRDRPRLFPCVYEPGGSMGPATTPPLTTTRKGTTC